MRKVISKLLLLALVAGICNAQAQAPARPGPGQSNRPAQPPGQAARPGTGQPNRPAQPPAAARPGPNNNAVPGPPARQQGPITRQPNTPTRAPPTSQNNNGVNRPAQPNRPLPQNPQQPQQSPVQRPNNAPTRPTPGAPQVRPTPAPPAANVPRPGTQAPPAPLPPAANVPTPGGGGNQATTTARTTTTRRVPNDGGEDIDLVNFPTAPTIAPTPDVIFVTPRLPGNPVHPNVPITPWNPRLGEGRPDQRCPLTQDSRNPTHLAHESDCGRFYKCDHGIAFEYRCPEGQHWNARRNYCDFPSNANCRSGNQNINNGVPVVPLPPHSPQVPDWNPQWNNNQNNWNNPNSNIVPWTNAPINNQNPGFENPIIIPMAPRS